jgi:SsrA-binding protein
MSAKPQAEKVIATNPLAHSKYFIEETLEAGMVLQGTEAKSLRMTAPNLRDAYVEVRRAHGVLEAWLVNCHIGPYSHGNIWNHVALRPRKLLLHRHQIAHLFVSITQKGLVAMPMRMYFKMGRAKVELGVGKGKKKHDKRETLKKKDAERDMEVARAARRKDKGADYED